MVKRLFLFLLLGVSLHGQVPAPQAKVQTLTVENYCLLTIDRLKLARSSWQYLRTGPTAAQLQPLWNKYKTTEQEYLRFGGRNRKQIARFLEADDGRVKAQIDALSQEVRTLIKQRADFNEDR